MIESLKPKNLNVSDDVGTLLEQNGFGKLGVDLFLTVDPLPDESTGYILVSDDSGQSRLDMRLSGEIAMQQEEFFVQAFHKDRMTGRALMEKIYSFLQAQSFTTKGGTVYEVILALTPLRLIGVDKNKRFVYEAAFAAVRKQVT